MESVQGSAEFLSLVLSGDARAAVSFTVAVARGGLAPARLVSDLLAPAQVEIGRLWHRGEATVLDEHRATAAVDAALAAVEHLDIDARLEDGPRVLVVSAEGEWHALSARMAAVLIRATGADVDFAGPSVPARDVERHVAEREPDVLAVSCSSVAALPGAALSMAAGAAQGVPVVVGGYGFGADGRWAEAIGAPWTDNARRVLAVARRTSLPSLDHAAVMDLDRVARGLAAAAAAEVGGSYAVAEASLHLVGFVRAAVLLHDPSVVDAHRPWLEGFLQARGEDADLLGPLCEAVAREAPHWVTSADLVSRMVGG